MSMFAIVTKESQKNYEQGMQDNTDLTPDICGYHGRGCRQMDKTEGCNRALCHGCGLAEFCGGFIA